MLETILLKDLIHQQTVSKTDPEYMQLYVIVMVIITLLMLGNLLMSGRELKIMTENLAGPRTVIAL